MIKPHKYFNLDNSVLTISGLILKVLNEQKVIKYDELYNKILTQKGDIISYGFLPSLNFLYLLGKLDYHQDTDSLELIEYENYENILK
ncbi:ABC-three component system middle component 8 [Paenibacillus sp. HWE-109]|uniref:ABC-three component system middle component 8 n=1 Tax=Paenibacillus sp. HWE-109 TaxID=1306526 RepID=UPI003FCE0F4B